ncbi:MAG: 5'-3' exonuclease [Planctomycetota bacterium]|jgi:5'-3' exonuclease
MKVHLVDGTFELFRCFHATPRGKDADGHEVGAGRGLLQTFVSLLRQPDVTHVAVAFDLVAPPSRKPVDDGDLIRAQTALAADVVRALGILVWPMVRYQADEALATGAARYKRHPDVAQVVICSTDKDFAQCIEGERVVLLDRIRKTVMDEAGVIERFGVPPARIPEYFALVGDPSDGLPGLPGWGAKSAAAVLGRYPSIEAIPDDPAAWDLKVRGAARLASALAERRREAYLYRGLSVRRTDVPLPDELEHLEWRGADRAAVEALTDRIGEKQVIERIPRWRS